MKKVIGVAVAASLVAGMAFADVAVSLNARLRTNMYHVTETENGTKTISKFDLDKSSEKHAGSDVMSDELAFNAKNDFSGIQLVLLPKVIVDSTDSAKSTGSIDADSKYNAWMTFGGLKLSFGTFDSRYVNRYNVTAGESGLLDADAINKYGTYLLGGKKGSNKATTTMLADANNLTALAGNRKSALVADYTFKDLPGTLMVKAGLLNGDTYSVEKDSDETTTQYAGYVFEADYSQKDLVKVQLLGKRLTNDAMILGAYVEPLMLPFNAVIGFSYGTLEDEKYTVNSTEVSVDYSQWAIDGRLSYNVSDALKVTGIVKFESQTISAVKGSEDYTNTALSLGGEVSYIVNDLATLALSAEYGKINPNSDLEDAKCAGDYAFYKIRPGVVVSAGPNARITAAFQYDKYTEATGSDTETEYSIPVIFRVKL